VTDDRHPDRRDLIAASFAQSDRPLVLMAGNGRVVAASAGSGRLFECDPETLVGRAVDELVVPADALQQCPRPDYCGSGNLIQVQAQTAAGELVPVEIRCSQFATGEGRHCLLFLSDLWQRAHEDELRAVRLAKLSLLNQVSEALYGANLTLEQILQAVLICVTAGQGLRFNRAFLLLVDDVEGELRGELAIGPGTAEEASRIWEDLADEQADLYEMMTTYDRSIQQTDMAVNAIVRRLIVPLEEEANLLVRVMYNRQAVRVDSGTQGPGVEAVS